MKSIRSGEQRLPQFQPDAPASESVDWFETHSIARWAGIRGEFSSAARRSREFNCESRRVMVRNSWVHSNRTTWNSKMPRVIGSGHFGLMCRVRHSVMYESSYWSLFATAARPSPVCQVPDCHTCGSGYGRCKGPQRLLRFPRCRAQANR